MTAIIIDGVQLHGTREVLIEATTSAVTTPLWLRFETLLIIRLPVLR